MPAGRTAAKFLLHSLGGIRGFRRAHSRGIRILMYHRFPPETEGLKRQCEIIRRHYNPVSMKAVADYLRGGAQLPLNPLAITIDDGYRDFLLHGSPVFQDYDIPTTVFLVSDFIDRKIWLWWNQLEFVLSQTKLHSLTIAFSPGDEFSISLAGKEERGLARRKISERLKRMESSQVSPTCTRIANLLEVEIPPSPPAACAPLTWDEVLELTHNGVEFGAHTKTHPILSRVSDMDQLREEIAGSKRRIEEKLGAPAVHFCYPTGRRADFNDATVKAVAESGFHSAVTTERGMNFAPVQPFLLRRIGVEPNIPDQYFNELLAGVRKE